MSRVSAPTAGRDCGHPVRTKLATFAAAGALVLVAGGQEQPAQEVEGAKLVEGIVYTTLRPPNLDIYLFDGRGQSPRPLKSDAALDYNAMFSPDGRWVVFTSERAGNADLYALDLKDEKTPPVPITRHEALDDAAGFSPSGEHLAFVSTRDGDADIFVMPFAPGDPTAESRAVNSGALPWRC